MNSNYLESKFDYIELLFNYFADTKMDDELRSHISKYLTVLISGMYEAIIKNIIMEFTSKEKMNKEIINFVSRQTGRIFRNPNIENITKILNLFNKTWIEQLKEKVNQENIDALNSIIHNKNLIAHGNTSIVTFQDIKSYYEKSKVILIELDSIILHDDS